MIADYVNDQIDVVSRAFLGLSVACARCHDHKFDPISTEDYYALAGIFFSTRIIPGPVAGNTPLVRVPLLSPAEMARNKEQAAADARRRAELEQLVPHAIDREYRDLSDSNVLSTQTSRYLVAACALRSKSAIEKPSELDEGLLAEWVVFLDRVEKKPDCPPLLRGIATGKLSGSALQKAADADSGVAGRR